MLEFQVVNLNSWVVLDPAAVVCLKLLLKVGVEKQRGTQLCHFLLFPKSVDICEGLHSLAEKQWFKVCGLNEINIWNRGFSVG